MVFKKGNIPWNKNKKVGSIIQHEKQFKKGHIPHNKGKTKYNYKPLKIVGEKTSIALKKYYQENPHDDEYKEKMVINCQGINRGKRPQSHIDAMTGVKHHMGEEWREKKRKYMEGEGNPMNNFKSREKVSQAKIRLYKEHPEKHLNKILDRKGHKTKIEEIMEGALRNEGINIIPQERLERFWVDIFIPEFDIVVECDGDYWHNYPEGTDKDRYKTEKLEEAGYLVLRFWERDIYENVENCVALVINAIDRLNKFSEVKQMNRKKMKNKIINHGGD